MATTTPAGVRAHAKHGGGPDHAPMTHRQIMEALSGLLLGMFVAILSSTIVSNALPEIIGDLGGGQSAHTWVVTAALLSMTAATPLWGKLADLYSKKALVQIALVIYVVASMAAGLSQNPGMLITFRVFQGIGVGGLSALAQIVMAAMISPRERGRYPATSAPPSPSPPSAARCSAVSSPTPPGWAGAGASTSVSPSRSSR